MDEAQISTNLEVSDPKVLLALSGPNSQVLGEVARESGASVNLRGNTIFFSGNEGAVEVAHRFLKDAATLVEKGVRIGPEDVAPSLRSLRADPDASLVSLLQEVILVSQRRRPIVPKGPAQRRYIHAIRNHDLTFGVGPAGTGKTYLAMAMAAGALLRREVKRIVLTRPAVEAGEKLGFLPGDLAEKINPYLRPLYDALHDMLDFDRVDQLRERGQIEIAPLAFMRGRTLNDSFIILDEAQNATSEQMRMFLTRLGFGSKAVVTGDMTQTDLPPGARSGLREAVKLLGSINGISLCHFSDADVVRHSLVQKIVVAYERLDRQRARAADEESEQAEETEREAESTSPADDAETAASNGETSVESPADGEEYAPAR